MSVEPNRLSQIPPIVDIPLSQEASLSEKNMLLRKAVRFSTRGLHQIEDHLMNINTQNSRVVAAAAKTYAQRHMTGFPTLFYGLGAGDVAGVRDFLPAAGGTVWSIGQEDFTSTQGLRFAGNTLNEQLFEVKEKLVENQLHGFYHTPEPGIQPLSSSLGLAVNLAIAGILPENVEITQEQAFERNGYSAKLTTLALFDGERRITWHIVSGIKFPRETPLNQEQIQLISDIIASQGQPEEGPALAISKASHSRGVLGLFPFLTQQTESPYVIVDNLHGSLETAYAQQHLEHWTNLGTLLTEDQPTHKWGYQANIRNILVGRLHREQETPTGGRR